MNLAHTFSKKSLPSLLVFCLVFLLSFSFIFSHVKTTFAAQEQGVDNVYSAGDIQEVPAGFALTAIGYGSDDWKCILGIKTAAVKPDGTVDFATTDANFQVTTCQAGAPDSSRDSYLKVFEPNGTDAVIGFSWGADTSGGIGSVPGDGEDSFPDDECFYQAYRNLTTGAVFSFGQASTGTCADRGYNLVDLKTVASAPAGRVIVGIEFNVDNDASLSFLAITTRYAGVPIPPPVVIPTPVDNPPTLTLLGANPLSLVVGSIFVDPGATATDAEDVPSNLTPAIATTSTVNMAVVGSYTVTYKVSDSKGHLVTATRTVTVTPVVVVPVVPPVVPPVTSGGGGGGGGGSSRGGGGPVYPNNLTIFNEQVVVLKPGVATVSWSTNMPATADVFYDTASHSVLDTAGSYGYTKEAGATTTLITFHTVDIPVIAGQTYFFRAFSTENSTGIFRKAESKELTISGNVLAVVAEASVNTGSCDYLRDYLRADLNNDPAEVAKLQIFFKNLEGVSNMQVTGVYDSATVSAVNAFQVKYKADILAPWGTETPSGYVYILTKKKVNEIYCNTSFAITVAQQKEIENYRKSLTEPKEASVSVPLGTNIVPVPVEASTTIGVNTDVATTTPTNIFGVASRLTGNVFYAIGSLIGSITGSIKQVSLCTWLNIILFIALCVVSYFWYQEYHSNRKLKILNEEIDLS